MPDAFYAHEIGAPVQIRVIGPTGTVVERSEESGGPAYLVQYEAEPGDVVAMWVREVDLSAAP